MNFRDLFHGAARAVDGIERCNRQIAAMREKVSSPGAVSYDLVMGRGRFAGDAMGYVDAMLEREAAIRAERIKEYQSIIDAAWDAVGIVSADLSDVSAQALSEHYLFGHTWQEVARSIGKQSRTTPRDLAYAALDWLESYCEVFEDADGLRVRVQRG